MASWKRVALVSASAGAGVAVVVLLILGIILWLSARPKGWNPDAVKVTFQDISYHHDRETLYLVYALENTTESDYEISEDSTSHTELFVRWENNNSLTEKHEFKILVPVFLPSKQRVSVIVLQDNYQCPPNLKGEEVKEHFRKELSNIAGFVLFDKTPRYQINFPKGW